MVIERGRKCGNLISSFARISCHPWIIMFICVSLFIQLAISVEGTGEKNEVFELPQNRVPGLRPSGPSNPKCLSQEEQFYFWKTFGLEPSESFKQAIREYEEFHADCRSKEGNLAEAIAQKKELPCKYTIWIATYDGLGNRFLSAASALIYSMLTKRVLLTDRRWDIENFLCEPFPKSSWLLPKEVDTEALQNEYDRMGVFTSGVAKANEENRDPTVPFGILADINHATEADMTFFCPSETEDINKIPLMLIRSNMYFVVGLYYTSYRSKLDEWFPDRHIFTHVARYLFSPVNSIWAHMKSYWQNNMASSDQKLGIHVRTFEHPWRREKSHRLLQCAQKKGLLPEVNSEENEASSQTTACLMASLKKEFYEHLSEAFNKSDVLDVDRLSIHKISEAEEQKFEQRNHNIEVMVEMWLLSFCDNLIMSPGSTFGYTSIGLRGKKMLFINGLFHNSDDPFSKEACYDGTTEPCFHQPPYKVRCFRDPTFDDPWHMLPDRVEQCHDYPRGARLVTP